MLIIDNHRSFSMYFSVSQEMSNLRISLSVIITYTKCSTFKVLYFNYLDINVMGKSTPSINFPDNQHSTVIYFWSIFYR